MNVEPKTRWPLAQAGALAEDLHSTLSPLSLKIKIVGSVRRGRPTVGDIELLYIPKTEDRMVDMFASAPVSLADEQIEAWLKSGLIAKRPNKVGVHTWGQKNKLAVHVESGIPVDFFSTTHDNWWVSLVIRTGSKDTNLKLTTGAQKLGRTLHAYGSGVTMPDGSSAQAKSEEEVFDLCGVPYLNPNRR